MTTVFIVERYASRKIFFIEYAVITEYPDNLNITRDFTVSHSRVFHALQWIIANNLLYNYVVINNGAKICEENLTSS